MDNREKYILTQFLSRFGIKNSRKALGGFLITLSILFFSFAGIPTWVQVYEYFFSKKDNITQSVINGWAIFWMISGTIFLFFGLVLFLKELFGYSEHKKRIDSLILKDWDDLLSTNTDFDEYMVHRLMANHSFFEYQIDCLDNWIEFHQRRENKLKNKKMKSCQRVFLFNLNELHQFTQNNFSPVNNTLFRMAPQFPRHSADYEKLEEELIRIVQKCIDSNNLLRTLIDKKISDYNSRLLVQ